MIYSINGLHSHGGGAGRCRFCGIPAPTVAGMPQMCTSDECAAIAAREGECRGLTDVPFGVPSDETSSPRSEPV